MRVNDLIKMLEGFNQELEVLIPGEIVGMEKVGGAQVMRVVRMSHGKGRRRLWDEFDGIDAEKLRPPYGEMLLLYSDWGDEGRGHLWVAE